MTVDVPRHDPMFTESHRRRLAAAVATSLTRGVSVTAATAAAEADLYKELLGVTGKEHDTPKH